MDLEEVNNFEWLIDNCLLIESFRSGNKNEDEYVFWPWEVWHFVCVLLNIINDDHFRVLSSLLGFFTMFRRKKVVTNFSMLYTLDEVELKECTWAKKDKTRLCKSRSRKDDFSSRFCYGRAANDEFPASVTCYGQLRMRNMIKQTNPYSSAFYDLKLSDVVFSYFAWLQMSLLVLKVQEWNVLKCIRHLQNWIYLPLVA